MAKDIDKTKATAKDVDKTNSLTMKIREIFAEQVC